MASCKNGFANAKREKRMKPETDTSRSTASQQARRKFLKQVAAGLAAGATPFAAIAQDKATPSSAVANAQPALAETLARYAAELKYEDLPDDIVFQLSRI